MLNILDPATLAADCRNLPLAWGAVPGKGVLKQVPEDFDVEEVLGFEPDGSGEHLCLWLEKTQLSTLQAQQMLAKAFNVAPVRVGYCGMKDKQAVSRQWFSVQTTASDLPALPAQLHVLNTLRNSRKLRIGSHRGNSFRLRIRQINLDAQALDQRLEQIRNAGIPNYFGPQRFGNGCSSLLQAYDWFSTGKGQGGRAARSMKLSAARAFLFNRVLATRIDAGNWNTALPGELLSLAGTGSVFSSERASAEELITRMAAMDIHPSGPLWGKGSPATGDACLLLEEQLAANYPVLASGLAGNDLQQERRALRCTVEQLHHAIDGDDLLLQFTLGKGCYATAVLREIVQADGI